MDAGATDEGPVAARPTTTSARSAPATSIRIGDAMTLSSVRQSTRDGWLAEVRHDATAWSAVADEWEDLYARCSASNPFVTHSWLSSWWRHYGRGRPLVLVLVRRHGRLVAA